MEYARGIPYGTLLSSTQLHASATVNGASVAGTYTYTYATAAGAPLTNGSLLNAGTHTLFVTFTPTNLAHYNPITGTVVLVVNKVPLIVTAADKTKVYGDPNPTLTAVFSGFVNGEILATSGVAGVPDLATVAAASGVAPDHPIMAAIGSLTAANYSFSFVAGKLAITRATLTVTAAAATKVYGDPVPNFAYGVTGFKNTDTALNAYTGVPSFSTSATAKSIPGDYGITPGIGSLAATNYNFTFVANTLTVTKGCWCSRRRTPPASTAERIQILDSP